MEMRRKIQKGFKFRGLTMRAGAVRALESVLAREDNVDEAMDVILDTIKANIERGEFSGVVDEQVITKVIAELSRDEKDLAQDAVVVVDSFKIPTFKYNTTRKNFFQLPTTQQHCHVNATFKTDIFRDRFTILRQRLLRNEMFSPPILGQSNPARPSNAHVQLTQIESLIGSSGRKCILGVLSERDPGEYFLEDLNGRVRLNLAHATPTVGMFTVGCIVLVEGEMADDTFFVDVMGFPPPETRAQSCLANGGIDFLGLPNQTEQEIVQMKAMEEDATDAMFVVLSDVHLDDVKVRAKLRTLFSGFEPLKPPLFILMGNFASKPFGQGPEQLGFAEYANLFEQLGEIMCDFPDLLVQSHFVFVPGPADPGSSAILPRHPIAKCFTKALLENVLDRFPNARITFATNPCRIKYYTQEIVVFRDNLIKKLRRHCVVPPISSTTSPQGSNEQVPTIQLTEHLVKTLVDQAHLCPVHVDVQPVFWAHDSALRLYPAPNLMILADDYDQYQWKYSECGVFNPGPFHSDFSFVVYRPATWETEFSKIEEDP